MGLPMYDCAVRTSNVTANAPLAALLPQAAAPGTGRAVRLRYLVVSNTTATGFGIGWGMATSAGATPGGAGTIVKRSTTFALDPASVCTLNTTYGTAPSFAGLNGRLWVPGNSTVIWSWPDGEELLVPPAATPFPFIVVNTGTGQIADLTLTWEE